MRWLCLLALPALPSAARCPGHGSLLLSLPRATPAPHPTLHPWARGLQGMSEREFSDADRFIAFQNMWVCGQGATAVWRMRRPRCCRGPPDRLSACARACLGPTLGPRLSLALPAAQPTPCGAQARRAGAAHGAANARLGLLQRRQGSVQFRCTDGWVAARQRRLQSRCLQAWALSPIQSNPPPRAPLPAGDALYAFELATALQKLALDKASVA